MDDGNPHYTDMANPVPGFQGDAVNLLYNPHGSDPNFQTPPVHQQQVHQRQPQAPPGYQQQVHQRQPQVPPGYHHAPQTVHPSPGHSAPKPGKSKFNVEKLDLTRFQYPGWLPGNFDKGTNLRIDL